MKRLLILMISVLFLASCSASNEGKSISLSSLGPAPELENEVWINTDQPLRLADLRGQVVLLDMWTFG